VIRFVGEVKAKQLTVSDIKPNAKLAKLTEEITIACGGKTQTGVKLPGASRENGIFELQIETLVGGKKVASSTIAYVRYEAFSPRSAGVKGPVLAFITGSDGFNAAAERFWKQHADTVIANDGMSLAEIVSWLRSHKDRYGSYGEVNIVTHGNERTVMIRGLPRLQRRQPPGPGCRASQACVRRRLPGLRSEVSPGLRDGR
jgi:hypothetical protein